MDRWVVNETCNEKFVRGHLRDKMRVFIYKVINLFL
jgi:hypothetical protein